MTKKKEFSDQALDILPILSFHRQIFFKVDAISKMCSYWDYVTAQCLMRLEERGWVKFAKRISNPKQVQGLDDTLYVGLKERLDRIQKIKNDKTLDSNPY